MLMKLRDPGIWTPFYFTLRELDSCGGNYMQLDGAALDVG